MEDSDRGRLRSIPNSASGEEYSCAESVLELEEGLKNTSVEVEKRVAKRKGKRGGKRVKGRKTSKGGYHAPGGLRSLMPCPPRAHDPDPPPTITIYNHPKDALPFISPKDAPPLPYIATQTVASRVQGKAPFAKSLASVLKPLPKHQEYVGALIPAYNEEASDVLTTLTDLWCQEQLLGGDRKIITTLILDGLDRGPDNPRKIISQSMEDFLNDIFPDTRPTWQAFESDFDESSNLILQSQNANTGDLAPVEFAEGMALQLIVLVKRTNRLKFNSHEWFLKGIAYHYMKQIPYVFLTDAGTGFDRNCLRHLVDHLSASNEDVVAVTGRQRVKTAAMQTHGMICAEPIFGQAWWLRSLQAYEYEAGVSTFNGVFSLLGYMPVLPGPCALLKYHTCLKDGGIDEYLDLVNSPPSESASEQELWQRGNENLAEDRILSFTIVFPSRLKAVRRTEWVPLALFYYDAELDLKKLCPQRRRWINGTYAAYLTVASR